MRVNFAPLGKPKDVSRELAGVKNPWIRQSQLYPGHETQICDAGSRSQAVKDMPAERLLLVIAWPGTQKTVRLAAERRLRKLTLGVPGRSGYGAGNLNRSKQRERSN